MPLTNEQSGPGNRFNAPDGKDYDVIARVHTDQGPFVITTQADAGNIAPGALINEGNLRDDEDVAFVSTTAEAKATVAEEKQAAEDAQIAADRQARIDATAANTDTTVPTDAERISALEAELAAARAGTTPTA